MPPAMLASCARRLGSSSKLRVVLLLLPIVIGPPIVADAACPHSAAFVSAARGTTLDLGWTGIGHGIELGSLRFTLGLGPCASSGGTCGSCPVSGLVDRAGQRRCTGDAAMTCRGEADCQGAGSCQLFLRSPVAAVAGGVGWCLLPSLESRVQGTVNALDGAVAVDLPLTLDAYQGPVTAPCPVCVGDTTAADGRRDGKCDGGARADQPCDADGVGSSNGGAPSLDCPPAATARFGALAKGTGSLRLTSGARTRVVDAASPDVKAAGRRGLRSLCDVCADDPSRPCASDVDCDGGVCGGTRGAPTAPNSCDDGVCDSSDGVHGTCSHGPFDGACGPAEPSRSCATDADCPVRNDRCVVGARRCFPGGGKLGDAVTARGSTERPSGGKARSTLAALFCAPPGRNGSVNQLLGLPGLGRVLMPGTWTFGTQAVEVLP